MLVLTGILLIVLPIAFNVAFAALAARFDYPDILRRPTGEVLERFRAGGSSLVLLWWAFAMTAVLLAPGSRAAVGEPHGCRRRAARDSDRRSACSPPSRSSSVSSAGRSSCRSWPERMPRPTRRPLGARRSTSCSRRSTATSASPSASTSATSSAASWTILSSVAIMTSGVVSGWIGARRDRRSARSWCCARSSSSAPFEDRGWRLAGAITPFVYIAWSLWLVATGIALLVAAGARENENQSHSRLAGSPRTASGGHSLALCTTTRPTGIRGASNRRLLAISLGITSVVMVVQVVGAIAVGIARAARGCRAHVHGCRGPRDRAGREHRRGATGERPAHLRLSAGRGLRRARRTASSSSCCRCGSPSRASSDCSNPGEVEVAGGLMLVVAVVGLVANARRDVAAELGAAAQHQRARRVPRGARRPHRLGASSSSPRS